MSPKDYRKQLREYRGRMCSDSSIDDMTYDAYCWWMNKQISEMDAEMKKNRPGRRSSLRTRLKDLLSAILAYQARHENHPMKEVTYKWQ